MYRDVYTHMHKHTTSKVMKKQAKNFEESKKGMWQDKRGK